MAATPVAQMTMNHAVTQGLEMALLSFAQSPMAVHVEQSLLQRGLIQVPMRDNPFQVLQFTFPRLQHTHNPVWQCIQISLLFLDEGICAVCQP
jgi:hypothetical protein